MYEMKTRIRFSETDKNGVLSMSGLLRLFQDCGYAHAYIRGQTPMPDMLQKSTWYLVKWHIERYKMPRCHEEVKLATWIYKQGGSIAYKQIILTNAVGEILALGDTMWAYVDIESEKPCMPPTSIWQSEDFGKKIELKHTHKRIAHIDFNNSDIKALPERMIDYNLVDINNHANNVLLTECAMKLSEYGENCSYLAAEFLRQAKIGEHLYPYITENDTGKTVAMCDSAKIPYAMFRFE